MTGSELSVKIIVAEFPKSGGSWLVSMLGSALNIPKRDIYVDDQFLGFDLTHHPWYEGEKSYNITDSCVIKSHELPDSSMHGLTPHVVHLVRDGRDVVVSKYFHDKDFCVKNGIFESFDMTFSEFIEKTSSDWAAYVKAWSERNVLQCRYEDLLNDPSAELRCVLDAFHVEISENDLSLAVEANTKEKMRKSLDKAFKYNTFVRKGIAGDWHNHFSEQDKALFKRCAGDALIELGYEKDLDW